MSKFRKGLMKRVMAVILSGAMVMSNMTAYAAEIASGDTQEHAETVSEASEPETEETTSKEAEKADAQDTAGEAASNVPSEGGTIASTETTAPTEASTETQTEAKTEAETTVSTETDKTETETSEAAASTEIASETEIETETETTESTETASETEEATETETETESTQEETTEESVDNAEAAVTNFEITEALIAGQEYGDDILKFTVLGETEFKTAKTPIVVGENEYTKYVAGKADAKAAEDASMNEAKGILIPVTGAAYKIQPSKKAKITFVVSGVSVSSKGQARHWYFVEDDGATGTVVKKSPEDSFESGAYDCSLEAGKTYYFYVNGSKVNVYNISWQEKNTNRPAWEGVKEPVISKVALSETNNEKIQVTVDTVIGDEGADKLTVYMYDENGDESERQESNKEANSTTIEFAPSESGKYTFKAEISREGVEDVKTCEYTEPIECKVTEKMNWDDWDFLEYGNGINGKNSYKVDKENNEIKLVAGSGKIVPGSNDGVAFYYTKVPTSKNFTFTANAHVNSWTFSNGQEGFGIMAADQVGETGARVWNNSYQAVISRISYKWNGVGISEDGSGEPIEMQIGVGSTEKVGVTPQDVQDFKDNKIGQPRRFKAQQKALDTTYAKLGDGTYNIVANYTNSDVKGSLGEDHVLYQDFWLQIQKNNTGYFVSYGKYKCETDEKGRPKKDEKGRAIYALEDGKKVLDESTIITQKYYDTEALNLLDSNYVYVGVFGARNVDITFSDISLKRTNPKNDPDPEERKVKLINLSKEILSGSLTNTPEHTFLFASNWKGILRVKDSTGKYIPQVVKDENGNPVKDENGDYIPEIVRDENGNPVKDENGNDKILDYYEVNGTLDPAVQYCQDGDNAKDTKIRIPIEDLSIGQNVFTVEYTPEEGWFVEEEEAVRLKSYETVKFNHTVEYKKYGMEGNTIYVSQDGKPENTGTEDSPLDIYTAVKYALPGQTILLSGGTYSLNRTLQIPKTVCGQPDKVNEKGEPDENGKETYKNYIKMIGDPNERTVLDFNSLVAAVVTVGDYWYFKDFDVIRCKDGEKGIQVSGSYCVFDRVDTYRNGSTGLQICRASGTDTYKDWPHDNLILNCNSFLNVDIGQEDADGFAAKLTSGSNNVFDGCIAAFNADDGWDLFAKAQTGSIGGVIIRNSIAYRNGYLLITPSGEIKTPAEAAAEGDSVICVKGNGNGNGFKMGGDGLRAGSEYDEGYGEDKDSCIPNIGHRLYNSLSFGNKSKGFDSNSAPNIKAYDSISFNNDGANISFATYDYVNHTDYELSNCVSIRSKENMVRSQVEPDVQTFSDGYTTTHSINFAKETSGSNKSAAIYMSLKNVKDKEAKIKVWWRSSDPNKDSQIVVLSEKDAVLAEGDYSKNGELMISELATKETEKIYLGSKGGSMNLYRVEVTATVKQKIDKTDKNSEEEYVPDKKFSVDISNDYGKPEELKLNGTKKFYNNATDKDGIEISAYYSAIPKDGIEAKGQQTSGVILDKVENDTAFYYRGEDLEKGIGKSTNKSGEEYTPDDFKSLDYPYLNTIPLSVDDWRNEDGTINVGDFLKLEPKEGENPNPNPPSLGGNSSPVDVNDLIGDDVDGTITGGTNIVSPSEDFGDDYPQEGLDAVGEDGKKKYYGQLWGAEIKYLDYTSKEPIRYTGKKIEPEVHVRFSADPEVLRKGKAYTIKYSNNINAGTATATIKGINQFTGFIKDVNFEIGRIDVKDKSVAIPNAVAVKNIAEAEKLIKPTWQGKAMKKDTEYQIKTVDVEGVKKICITGIGNFEGTKYVDIHDINSISDDKLITKAKISIVPEDKNQTYSGAECTPRIEVTKKDGSPIDEKQYMVAYANNIEIGKATITVFGDGTNYYGSKSITFNIKAGNLKDVAMVVNKSGANRDKEFKAPESVIYNGKSAEIPVNSFKVVLKDEKGNATTTRLKKDIDYKVVQSGTNKAGSASLTIKGINHYKGAISYKYKILPRDLEKDKSEIEILYAKTLDYTVGGTKFVPGQNFNIKINGHNIDTRNYRLSYRDNRNVGQATVIISGQKSLTGKIEQSFNIAKTNMEGNPDFNVTYKDVITNGKPLTYADLKKANIGITQMVNGKAKKLSAGRDYDKDKVEYYIDVDGDYKLTEADGKPVDITSKSAVQAFADKGYVTVLVKVRAAAGSECGYTGELVDWFRAAKWGIQKAKVENLRPRIFGKNYKKGNGLSTPMTWTDTEVAKIEDYLKFTCQTEKGIEEVTCQDLIGAYTYDNDYLSKDGFAIVPNSYKKNDRVGMASFTIIGTGKYAGTKKVSFKIINKAVAEKTKTDKSDPNSPTQWESTYN